jgi:hypothetical protein
VAENGKMIHLDVPAQDFDAVLQSSIVLPFHAAYYLLAALEESDVRDRFNIRSSAALRQAMEDEALQEEVMRETLKDEK